MEINNKKVTEYEIPFKEKSSYKWIFHLLFFLLVALFVSVTFISGDTKYGGLGFRIFFAIMAIAFLYLWIYTGVLRCQFLELTEDCIRVKTAFGTKTMKWSQIQDIQVFTQGYNTMIGIVLKEKARKRKENFWNLINGMYGGMFSVTIAMSQYPNLNVEKMYTTMINMLIKTVENSPNEIDNDFDTYSVKAEEEYISNNIVVALLKLLLLSIGIGLLYGLSIFILKVNIVVVPIFGSIAIIYYYSRFYKEEKINIIVRAIVGIICSIQIFIAVILDIFLESKIPISIDNFIAVNREYFKYFVSNPSDEGIVIIIAIFCFGYGAFQGHKFKFQKRIQKLFMKKSDKHYYKKEGRIITIYLKDPVAYNEQQEGMLALQIYKACFIEKERKKVKGLYIPTECVNESGISIAYDDIVSIGDGKYYKMDLGSTGNYQPYAFPCVLIVNSKKETEIIQIEI